jgi:hypothetical protein
MLLSNVMLSPSPDSWQLIAAASLTFWDPPLTLKFGSLFHRAKALISCLSSALQSTVQSAHLKGAYMKANNEIHRNCEGRDKKE